MGKKQDKKDLPRGLQIDTTTGEGANITEEEIMVPKKKPVKAVLGVLALGAAGAMGAKKLLKKDKKITSVLSPISNLLDEDKDKDKSQKETGNAKMMNVGGEVTVGKGGDYIKDLID
tara:strand:- start:11435 stop:11785 length:351 start_codon:yes stop_codon:yes gene_type:complete